MQSSHFHITLVETYRQMVAAAGLTTEEFVAAARYGNFIYNKSVRSAVNFAATCRIICEVRLPHHTSLARVSVHEDPCDDDRVVLYTSTMSASGGREYLEQLAQDAALALVLFNLISDAARSLRFKTDDA